MSAMTNRNYVLLLGFLISPMHLEVFQYVMFPASSDPGDSCGFEDMKGAAGLTILNLSTGR